MSWKPTGMDPAVGGWGLSPPTVANPPLEPLRILLWLFWGEESEGSLEAKARGCGLGSPLDNLPFS